MPEKAYGVVDKTGEHADKPSKTYRLLADLGDIEGFTDGLEAVSQAVYKILKTERYRYPVYSSDYGVELSDLYGRDCDYAGVELERRIAEALSADERVTGVFDYDFTVVKNKIRAVFTVGTVYGELNAEKEVTVSV
ncbi:MAG: DUF2634 domain-containing protein [Oscillospiraceae bacterium]|nr:DUF2634 domain-containing protein [Oscillospiraceae bacterium]